MKKDETIEYVMDRQINAVIGDIYGVFFSADSPDKVSLHDILNRVMLLLQAPVTFILCKQNEDKEIIPCYIFNKEPFHQISLKKALQKAIDDQNSNPENKIFFRLFNSDYLLLVLVAPKYMSSHDYDYDFTPLYKGQNNLKYTSKKVVYDNLIYKLENIIDGEIYKKRFGDKFLKTLQERLDSCRDDIGNEMFNKNKINHYQYIKYKDIEHYNKDFIEALEKDRYGKRYGYDFGGVIDKVYSKSRKSLSFGEELSSDNEENSEKPPLPNFFIYLRDYTKSNYSRHEKKIKGESLCYDYSLRMLVCSNQENDIKNYLKYIREKSLENNYHKEWYIINNFEKDNDYIGLAKIINDSFWEKVDSDDGIRDLIDTLKKPFNENAYSIADPVFSGIINFRDPSIINGGLHRAISNEQIKRKGFDYKNLKKEVKNDLLRIVLLHYLFAGMANLPLNEKNEKSDFMVMLNPLEIGARIIGVIGYVTIDPNPLIKDDKEYRNEEERSKAIKQFGLHWRQNYHIHQDTYARLKRGLRSYFWQLYIQTLADIYTNTVITLINEDDITKNKLEDIINEKFHLLTKFFSYSGIRGEILENSREKSGNVISFYPNKNYKSSAFLSKKYHFKLRYTSENQDGFVSHFPISPGRLRTELNETDNVTNNFVDLNEIAVMMTNKFYIEKK